jgi:hypothetical protein
MKHICFYLSAQEVETRYEEPALELVRLVVSAGHGFVYGGTNTGLMKKAADEVEKLNGHTIAISSVEFEKNLRPGLSESYICTSIGERKKLFLQKSDVIVVLPGGAGTLDEVADAIEQKKIGNHSKPIVLLNSEGFWDGLITQYTRMYNDGFWSMKPTELFIADADPGRVLEYKSV